MKEPIKEVEETKEEVKELIKEVEETKEEVKEPEKEVEGTKEEIKEPTKEIEGTKEEVKESEKEVEEVKEEIKELATELDQEPKGNNQVVENEERKADTLNKQHTNKPEEGKKSLPSTGGEASTSTLLSGITLVLSALNMFVFRKRLFKK
ncbi:hypothetical protein BN2127_JRS1_02377 [Bacillus cereus]|nr:hypothetical protein BN2127_JRS1_02377 [Bacillus cereus]